MIDFQNATFAKLKPVDNSAFSTHLHSTHLQPMFVQGEQIIQTFQGMRDGIVFTTARIFVINVQGITGKKKDFTSLPYSKIQAFSVETAGMLDMDSELEMWFSGLGKVKFEFIGNTNMAEICRVISSFVLK